MQFENDGRNDFDFLIGTWRVHHRTLKKRLHGSTEWIQLQGDMVSRKILNGLGILDENLLHTSTGSGRHMYSRFIWSKITANSAQWEQAFSEDSTKTWVTNWIMEFARV